MKNVIIKSALFGLVGVPVFIVASALSTEIMNRILESIKKHS